MQNQGWPLRLLGIPCTQKSTHTNMGTITYGMEAASLGPFCRIFLFVNLRSYFLFFTEERSYSDQTQRQRAAVSEDCYRKHLTQNLGPVGELSQSPRPPQPELIRGHLLTLPKYHTWRDPSEKWGMTGHYSQVSQGCLSSWGRVIVELLTSRISKLEGALGVIQMENLISMDEIPWAQKSTGYINAILTLDLV